MTSHVARILILLLGFIGLTSSKLTARLVQKQYDPIIFKLVFTEPVAQPEIQIMLNNIVELSHTFVNVDGTSDTFYIQGGALLGTYSGNLEQYTLIFTNPRGVGNGNLDLASYVLKASKCSLKVQFPAVISILIVCVALFSCSITVFGNILVQFIQLYILFMFRSTASTTIYRYLSQYLLIMDSTYYLTKKVPLFTTLQVFLDLGLPLLFILTFAVIGYLIKRILKNSEKGIVVDLIYNFFTYNFFITVSKIFYFCLFFNSIQYLLYINSGLYQLETNLQNIGIILSYLSFVTVFFIAYVFFYVLNPKINESEESWKSYTKSSQFNSFSKLHNNVRFTDWYIRNQPTFAMMKRLLLIGFFFAFDEFQYLVLLFEFAHIYYIFTVRPFKEDYYVNLVIIFRLLFFCYFSCLVLSGLYYGLGDITISYSSISSFVKFEGAGFCSIVLLFFLMIVVEIISKCRNLSYEIKIVKEQNQYKLKIIEKGRTDSLHSSSPSRNKSKTIVTNTYSKSSSSKQNHHSPPHNSLFQSTQIQPKSHMETILEESTVKEEPWSASIKRGKKKQKKNGKQQSVHSNQLKTPQKKKKFPSEKENQQKVSLLDKEPKETKLRKASLDEIQMTDLKLIKSEKRLSGKFLEEDSKSVHKNIKKGTWKNKKSLLVEILKEESEK